MIPYWFAALTMKSVGKAAGEMVAEVKRQFSIKDPQLRVQATVRCHGVFMRLFSLFRIVSHISNCFPGYLWLIAIVQKCAESGQTDLKQT